MDKPRHNKRVLPQSDDALWAMIRAAGEVDELHAGAEHAPPSMRLAGMPARVQQTRNIPIAAAWRPFAAVAALVAIGVMLFTPRPHSPPTHMDPPISLRPGPTLTPPGSERLPIPTPHLGESQSPAVASADSAVILTISQDADGRCRCVNSVVHQLAAGTTLGDLATSELLRVGMQKMCEAMPERVLVLGMSGPRDLLPRSKAEAERFASCLEHGPGNCDIDATCFASSALACVAPSVNIVAETVAMRK